LTLIMIDTYAKVF